MPRRIAPWWLASFAISAAAACMAVFGLWQLSMAEGLAVAEKSALVEPIIQKTLALAIAQQRNDELQAQLEQLIESDELGLVYMSITGPRGDVIAHAGRYERWHLPGAPDALSQSLRLWAYRWTGRFQAQHLRNPLSPDDASTPFAEALFVIAPGVAGQVNDRAVLHLAWSGVIAFLFAAIAGIASIFTWRRMLINPSQWAERLAPELKTPATPSYVDLDDKVHEQLPERLGAHLDALGSGLIVVDNEACIRYLNDTARRLTGWNAADVQGRLVYSVFHPLDARYSPMLTPAEVCMRDERPYPPTELRLRARDGAQSPIEVMALPLKRPSGTADGAMMIFSEISEREKRIDQWRRQARLTQGVLDHLSEGVLTTDPVGVIRFANARALRMFGYVWEDIEGSSVSKLMPVPFLNSPSVRLTDYISSERAVGLPKVVGWRKDATTFPVELVVQNLTIEHAQGLLVIVRDITERLRSDNLSQRLGRLLDAASDEVYIFDAQTLRFVEVNRGARRNLGYHPSEMTHMTPLVISEQLDAGALHGYLDKLREGVVENVTYRCQHRRADGSRYPVEVRLNYSREEEPPVFLAIAVDITEREQVEQRLHHMAHHDALTGLPNRATLLDRLGQAILASKRSNRQIGVLMLDVDHFKTINDQHGHQVGDEVLRQLAGRLRSVLRASDTVARLGGDEFVIVAQGLRFEDDALSLGRKILERFNQPMLIEGLALDVRLSIGVALCPADEGDAEALLSHADQAMYRSKQAGRGRCSVHLAEISPERRRLLDLERDVQTALTLVQFRLTLVPLERIEPPHDDVAMLASFYWSHPQLGRIEAEETLASAERAGLVADIELWRLRAAVHAARRVVDLGTEMIVPIAGWHWRHPEFGARVIDVLRDLAVPAQKLVIATDAAGLREARNTAQDNLYRLCSEGVRLAMHDTVPAISEALRRGGLPPLTLLIVDANGTDAQSLVDLGSLAREHELRLAILNLTDHTEFVGLLGHRWELISGLSVGIEAQAIDAPRMHR